MRRPRALRHDRRPQVRTIGIAALGAALLAVTACSSPSTASSGGVTGGNCTESKTPVKISVIADLSGASPTLVVHGKAVVAAATTAAHLANTSGGVNCAPVQLVVHDGAASAAGVTQAVRDSINGKSVAVTGFAISGFLAGSVPLITQAKIPWMSTSPTFQGVADIPYFYSTQVANKTLGTDAAEALKRELGGSLAGKKIAFEGTTNSATVDEILASLTAAVQAEGGTVGPVFRDPSVFTEWSSQAANAVSAGVDAVASMSSDSTNIVMNGALKTAGFDGKFLSIVSATDATFAKIANPDFISMRNAAFPLPGTPLGAAVQESGASLDDANASSYFGQEFAAATALVDTLRKCGDDCTADKFASTVSAYGDYTVPLDGLYGPMKFDPRVATMPVTIFRWDAAVSKPAAVGSAL
ncbi:MAG: hypothetical protein ABS81_09690 [Pseudonocardia sp. SCN 72-86]|nr:MAG: hypothetical protein ABS81_09690 [Pseudonocardia sp. SCN 72-86]